MLRAIFIIAGAALLEAFHRAIYVFGAFLVLTGVKMARHRGGEVHPERNPVLRALRRVVPMTSEYRGQRFFVKDGVRRYATPMLAVLVAVETTDVLFAVDSIPAIFAVTEEPFLVFTSNAFAILGLRALYFLLAGMMNRFVYLKLGLAAILVFVGAKMLLADVITCRCGCRWGSSPRSWPSPWPRRYGRRGWMPSAGRTNRHLALPASRQNPPC